MTENGVRLRDINYIALGSDPQANFFKKLV